MKDQKHKRPKRNLIKKSKFYFLKVKHYHIFLDFSISNFCGNGLLHFLCWSFRNSRLIVLYKKTYLNNCTTFIRKHLEASKFLFNKVPCLQPATVIKRRVYFPISQHMFTEQLRTTVSGRYFWPWP